MHKKLFLRFIFVTVTSAILLIFFGTGLAQVMVAQNRPQTGMEFMIFLDKDKDGKVSKEEFPRPHFESMDKNGDGFIVLEEADQRYNPPKDSVNANQIAFIVKLDKDKDGKLSNEEFTGSHFSNFDKNGDGFIEPHEAPEGKTAY